MAKALWHTSAKTSEISDVSLAERQAGHCEIRALYSLPSLGTERLVACRKVPPALWQPMQVPYMEGSFDLPLKYGYSLVGEVVTKDHPLAGQIVHLMHPHQDFCVVDTHALFSLPKGIPPKRASLASNLETAVTAIWDSKLCVGDRVLIVGFGLLGAMTAILASKFPGVQLWIAEINPYRQQMAQQIGFHLLDQHSAMPFDVAFNCSASEAGLQKAIDETGHSARVIELSWYGDATVNIKLGASFHLHRKKIIASQVSTIPASHRDRWDSQRRKELVFQLLQDPVFDSLITHEIPFEESPQFFEQLRQQMPEGLAWCITYP